MMDPKKYDKLIEQEDHFREKYNVEIFLKLSTAPDSKDSTGKKLHSAIMTVTGDSYIVRSSPSFRSDENGAFYRQIDAMVNARIKLVDWFKEMDSKGFLSKEDEEAFITGDGQSVTINTSETLSVSEVQDYFDWLHQRRREFEASH